MTDPARVGDVQPVLDALLGRVERLAGDESFGAHAVFAALYLRTNRLLLEHYSGAETALACRLTVIEFFRLYETQVVAPVRERRPITAPAWRSYAAFADSLGPRPRVNPLLWLLCLGAEAHVRHDLPRAIVSAAKAHRQLAGDGPDMEAWRRDLLSRGAGDAFFAATLDLNRSVRGSTSRAGRMALGVHAALAHPLRPVMIGVLQRWRDTAFHRGVAMLGAA
ncbi:DUF5995 family protein [Brevundimonas sp.]|uniref:DUF5995 family protein n=1 Tax=Brevundimonas sp. TaxID=1871086 RepID=UPI0025FCA51C|nr:DUF5995 family protein [Brevundimonas sp.]